ncbi:hypothetical protein [Paenibacillus sp. RC67]|uniref:hypothetical protein n=1 Tax=Paenibacillus sp. RC67 TaxID=3039392 RepID=UPI0024AE0063|nr:hypothetical protein [Paenibacillus sp. RC67]
MNIVAKSVAMRHIWKNKTLAIGSVAIIVVYFIHRHKTKKLGHVLSLSGGPDEYLYERFDRVIEQ